MYKELATGLGFKTRKIDIDIKEVDNTQLEHTFLIMYSKNGYAKLDQKDLDLFIYG